MAPDASLLNTGGGKIDKKLAHLVKKMMNPNDSSPPNTDYVVTILRTQHHEYLLKDSAKLRKDVEACVSYLMSRKSAASSSTVPVVSSSSTTMDTTTALKKGETSPASSRKRRAAERDEEEYDMAAAKEEAARETGGMGGGLNASLRSRYKQQTKQQAATTTSVVLSNKIIKPLESPSPTPQKAPEQTLEQSPKPTSGNIIKRKRMKVPGGSGGSSGAPGGGGGGDIPTFMLPVPRPTERYSDLGGMADTIQELRELVEYPLLRPELYRHLGIDPPRGVLLRGPPGTGKSHLANAVAGELGVNYFRVSAPELVSGMSGESEGRIRDLFQAASDSAPSVIFLDEIDAVAPKRNDGGGARGMEKRMVAQLLTSMDAIAPNQNRENAAVIILAATNRPDSLDPALRRAGRFDREILLGVPDEEAREKILRAMTSTMRLSGDFDYKVLARKTPGFVGADIRSLSKEAAVLAINRIFRDLLVDQLIPKEESENPTGKNVTGGFRKPLPLTPGQMEPLFVTMADFLDAVPLVQPSSKREGFATVPDVSWEDIGALQSIREELALSVLAPIRNPEKFKALGLTLPAGVLLYGPPGCGKTLLAKAIASESGANFISVKGPELLDKYVGESERAVRLVFERARASSPCIVFFDELDSLVPKRGSDSSSGGVSERVVNQLLTEMDGLESRRSVFVIAATNRPELIDPAMMRPGRLDKLLYVPLPTPEDRASILKALAVNIKLASDVDLASIGMSALATGYSGADCAALLREAGLAVIKEDSGNVVAGDELCIHSEHFDFAFKSVMPSVSKKDQRRYDRIRERMASARSHAVVEDLEEDEQPKQDENAKKTECAVPADEKVETGIQDFGVTSQPLGTAEDVKKIAKQTDKMDVEENIATSESMKTTAHEEKMVVDGSGEDCEASGGGDDTGIGMDVDKVDVMKPTGGDANESLDLKKGKKVDENGGMDQTDQVREKAEIQAQSKNSDLEPKERNADERSKYGADQTTQKDQAKSKDKAELLENKNSKDDEESSNCLKSRDSNQSTKNGESKAEKEFSDEEKSKETKQSLDMKKSNNEKEFSSEEKSEEENGSPNKIDSPDKEKSKDKKVSSMMEKSKDKKESSPEKSKDDKVSANREEPEERNESTTEKSKVDNESTKGKSEDENEFTRKEKSKEENESVKEKSEDGTESKEKSEDGTEFKEKSEDGRESKEKSKEEKETPNKGKSTEEKETPNKGKSTEEKETPNKGKFTEEKKVPDETRPES